MPNSIEDRGSLASPIDFCSFSTNDLLYDFLKATQKWSGKKTDIVYYTTAQSPEILLSKISAMRVSLSRIRTVKRSIGKPIKDFRFCGTVELAQSANDTSPDIYKIILSKTTTASLSDLNIISELF